MENGKAESSIGSDLQEIVKKCSVRRTKKTGTIQIAFP